MNLNNSFLKYKAKRKMKKDNKMRVKYSFLVDEFKACENRINMKFTSEIDSRILPEMKEEIRALNVSINELSKIIQNSQIELSGKIDKLGKNDISQAKKSEKMLQDSTNTIMSSAEEIKALLKISALNNLINDIDRIEEKN